MAPPGLYPPPPGAESDAEQAVMLKIRTNANNIKINFFILLYLLVL
jgi:hypothetical protein